MTEYDSFGACYKKNMCRVCLRVDKEVFPMTTLEINTYQSFAEKVAVMEWDMRICLPCKWMIKKCMKFTQQCRKANEILNENFTEDSKPHLFSETFPYDLKISRPEIHYLGPEFNIEFIEEKNGLDSSEEKEFIIDEHVDDDDELPLVMFQDDFKRGQSRNSETTLELEIKQETDIKQEYIDCQKIRRKKRKKSVKEECTEDCEKVRKKEKKKELKEGFSSRMVQETNEYIVIKLTKEQVLSELAEKAKADSYMRAPYKCDKCVKGFNFEDVLQTHMEKHSLEHGSYLCDICTQYCPSQVSLRGHLKSHTTRYKCKLCGQVRLSRQHLLEHHAITHTAAPTTYTCDKCQFTTNKRTVIQRHVKTHLASERHACHLCGKLFNTIESLRVHTMRHDKSKRLQCEHCDKHFIYPSLLHKHVQAVHERKDYYCVECDVRFKSPESLRLHFKKAKRHRDSSSYKFACPQCPLRVVSAAALAGHLSAAHGRARAHACARCRRAYCSREALRAHTWRVHTPRDHAARCHVCDKTFARKSMLKVHMRTHTGERPHVCACGAAFTQRASLKIHLAAKHNQKQEDIPGAIDVVSNIPQEA